MNGLAEKSFFGVEEFLAEKDIVLIEKMSWERVFELWHTRPGVSMINEEKRLGVAASWQEWREHYLVPLRLPELEWLYCKSSNPLKTIPMLRGGPFQSWSEKFYGSNFMTFNELIEIKKVREGSSVRRHYENPPEIITLVSLCHRGEIMIVEGMHKCLAIALAQKKGKILDLANVRMIVGLFDDKWELPLLAKSRNGMRLHHSI